jgi:quercetin dioxygenase-like cupin family protein
MFNFAKWAEQSGDKLLPINGELPLQMKHSDGTALPLVVSFVDRFGADIIRFEAGKGVELHTHIGSHILLVTKGRGILTYGMDQHEMFPGMIYLIPANVPHAILASTELVLIAIGNDHRPADSYERLDLVEQMSANNV